MKLEVGYNFPNLCSHGDFLQLLKGPEKRKTFAHCSGMKINLQTSTHNFPVLVDLYREMRVLSWLYKLRNCQS